jgi:hypothetical protein
VSVVEYHEKEMFMETNDREEAKYAHGHGKMMSARECWNFVGSILRIPRTPQYIQDFCSL